MFGLSRRDHLFFDLFGSQARVCREASALLHETLLTLTDLPARIEKIKSLEHQGDELTHRIFNETSRVFVTPLDREDIHALASSLDDVLDNIDAAAARLVLYKIQTAIPGAAKRRSRTVSSRAPVSSWSRDQRQRRWPHRLQTRR